MNNFLALDLPDGIRSCGDGWYSKVNPGRINAVELCRSQGYGDQIFQYGDNSGSICSKNFNKKKRENIGLGPPTNMGYHVSWKCERGNHDIINKTTKKIAYCICVCQYICSYIIFHFSKMYR